MKKNEFMLGCNYWASNAGTEMWVNWDETVVENDLKTLSAYGLNYLRVFPNWRDFQPVKAMYGLRGKKREFRMQNEKFPDNPYFLDRSMMERFKIFYGLCSKYHIKLIVGLLTGWMSGRLFIPPALEGKNLYSDPEALLFEQRFIKGFVSEFCNEDAIYAWDLGNECNCLSALDDRATAANWTSIIANTIRAYDNTRPVVSGMHSIGIENNWTIFDQAEHTDILTTHPYPLFVKHCLKDGYSEIRTLLHATCETMYYQWIGKRDCLVEEIGTLGPMLCSDELAADFLRVNLFSNWAGGAKGVLWWCGFDQTGLEHAPYSWFMMERELGLFTRDLEPKKTAAVYQEFSEFLSAVAIRDAEIDGICITTHEQDQWGVAYASYILAKEAGVNIGFAHCTQELPQSGIYLMPSISGTEVIPLEKYEELKARVRDGAVLYISNNDGILSEFSSLCGISVWDGGRSAGETETMHFKNETIALKRTRKFLMEECGAQVIARSDVGEIMFVKYGYGKGTVYYLNFPLETMLLHETEAFEKNHYKIYSEIFKDLISEKVLTVDEPLIGITYHKEKDSVVAVLINYATREQRPQLKTKAGWKIDEVIYGDCGRIPACTALVVRVRKDSADGTAR